VSGTLDMRTSQNASDELRARQRRAMELRARAYSVREIADEMGTSVSVVNAWISAAVREYIPAELREDVRALQLDRYHTLLRAYIEALQRCTTLDELDKCGRLIHQVLTRIDALCGTEHAKEVRIDGQVVPITQIDMELAELIREAKERTAEEEALLAEAGGEIDG
jgi:predicted transcriptional regulator